MQLHEFEQPLEQLEINLIREMESNQDLGLEISADLDDALARFQESRDTCSTISSTKKFINELEDVITKSDTDRKNFKLPYYNVLLAYAYHRIGDTIKATRYAELSESHFRNQSKHWHTAISHWFSGLLFYELGRLDKANEKTKTAINIISELDKEDERLGYYLDGYDNIRGVIETSCERIKKILLNGTFFSHDSNLTVSMNQFTTVISWLKIPFGDFQLVDFRNKLLNMKSFDLKLLNSTISTLSSRLKSERGDKVRDVLANILVAHCYNIGYYNGMTAFSLDAMEYTEFAIEDFRFLNDEYNQALSCWYYALLSHNTKNLVTCQAFVKEGMDLLDTLVTKYKISGKHEETLEISNIKKLFIGWFSKSDTEHKLAHRVKQNTSDSYFPSKAKDGALSWFSSRHVPRNNEPTYKKNSEPDATDMPKKESATSLVSLTHNNRQPPGQGVPPKVPGGTQSKGENDPAVRLIVIPVDMNALEKAEISDSPISHDLFEKLETYDKKYANLKGRSRFAPSQNDSRLKHVIIPSYPIRGRATANPNGKAVLPSIDGSQPDMAPEIHENSILRIQGCSYKVHLKPGLQEIRGKHYDWFQVDGDSMSNADPVPIEDKDFVLFNKKNCNPKSCDGQIVLASFRENNLDPTRLMVKRFTIMSPKRQADIEVTTPLLLSESLIKNYKPIVLTDEYQIEGEVVAIAKLIDE